MSLADYHRKRRFAKTPEPKGKPRKRQGRVFVVQQHRASRLHFDLRLELNGVLKSWAVPKGVSLDPADKRLAVHVEDHPLDYAAFEGIIPEGEYGAGAMIVWDRGEWEPLGDADKDYRAGELKFRLRGEKLNGAWMLVRMRGRPEEKGDNWLLIKERDETAIAAAKFDVVTERPESVISGRTVAEVAAGESGGRKRRRSKSRADTLLKQVQETPHAKPAPLPPSLAPALARMSASPTTGEQWLHEIKFDGYRIVAWLEHGKVQLRTRHGHDWTARFPEIAAAIEKLPANSALLDGEVVAFLPNGASSFSGLQQALSSRRTGGLVYCAFDLVHLEGYDLRQCELESRKALLQRLLSRTDNKRLHYVDHVAGNGRGFFQHCRELELEGMISKRRVGPYRSGRTDEWLKCKCVQSEPFVIGGYTTPKGEKKMRALVVGQFDSAGRLVYVGRVGSGFDEKSFADVERKLHALDQPQHPFRETPPKEAGREFHWVRPQLVAQVKFAGWSADGNIRHPVFDGLREDTDPAEVVGEASAPSVDAAPTHSATSAKRPPVTVTASDDEKLQQSVLDALSRVKLTSPRKVVYPAASITKLDLVRYYVEIADWILPHVVDRPLNLFRCPDGLDRACFFQKHAGRETPPTIGRLSVEEEGKTEECLFVRDLAGLISLVQVSALEIHLWGSRVDKPELPDRMIFDLDPDPAVPWPGVVQAATRIRGRLADLKLASFVKTTGGKGLHVTVPLDRRQSWDDLKGFSQRLAQAMAADFPQSYTANMAKRARVGKIYIDYVRNSRGATAIAPYSTRAKPTATVATPIRWDELTADLEPEQFTLRTIPDRLRKLTADPWEGIGDVRQALTARMHRKL